MMTSSAIALMLGLAHGPAHAEGSTREDTGTPDAAAGSALQAEQREPAGQVQAAGGGAGTTTGQSDPAVSGDASRAQAARQGGPDRDQQWTRRFGQIDQDQDGQISEAEARQHRERTFAALDADGDRTLSREEVGGYMAVHPGYLVLARMIPLTVVESRDGFDADAFRRIDRDKDNRLSRQEYLSSGEQTFAEQEAEWPITPEDYRRMTTGRAAIASEVDRDRDRKITEDEAAAHWAQTFSELDRNADEHLSEDEWTRAREERQQIERRFGELDADQDETISEDEFMQAGEQTYWSADRNADDQVSTWEYRSQPQM